MTQVGNPEMSDRSSKVLWTQMLAMSPPWTAILEANRIWRAMLACVALVVLGMAASEPAHAALGWAEGTVSGVGAYPPGSSAAETLFTLSPQPTTNCQFPGNFAISTATTVDQGIRKNMLAILLEAKATGATVRVMYDPAGGCDPTGFVAVYAIWII